MWSALTDTRGLRPPSVRLNHPAAPGDGAPRGACLRPGAKVSGSQTDLLNPWYDGRAKIIPFQYLPVLLWGNETSHVGWDTGDLPSQGKNCGHRTPPGPCCPRRRSRSRRRSGGAGAGRGRAKAMNEVDAREGREEEARNEVDASKRMSKSDERGGRWARPPDAGILLLLLLIVH
jgi:hypothetical protein